MRSVVLVVLAALWSFGVGVAAGTGLMWPQGWGSGYLAGQAARPEPVTAMTDKQKVDAVTECYKTLPALLGPGPNAPSSVQFTFAVTDSCLNNARTISGDDRLPTKLPPLTRP